MQIAYSAFRTTFWFGLLIGSILGADKPEDRAIQSIHPAAIAAHVTFLADDLLEGRGTGTRGYDIAAKYVAAEFQGLGLESAGTNGFFQPIRFRNFAVVPQDSTFKLTLNGNEETLTWGTDYFAAADPQQVTSTLSGQIVYVGHGIVESRYGQDDYKGVDVRGKIIAFLPGAPDGLPPDVRAHYEQPQTKLVVASSHGAIGAVLLWPSSAEESYPFSSLLADSKSPDMCWLDKRGNPKSEIRTAAVLSQHGIRKLFGNSLPLAKQAVELPTRVLIRTSSTHSGLVSSNVAAIFRGGDPALEKEYVVYTAHLDHLGIGEPVNGDNIYNGATDNAGSVAALVEIARAFTQLEKRQRRSVLFLAVTGEEEGLLGSDYFVEFPTVPRAQIVANINMDGLNLLFDFRNIVDIGGDHSSLGAVFRRAAAQRGVEAISDQAPEKEFFIRSDQYSFIRRGIPSLFPRTGTKAVNAQIDGAKMEADRMQFRWHTPSDDLNHPLDFVAGANTAKFNFLVGYIIAQEEARPHWNDGDFFGETFGVR